MKRTLRIARRAMLDLDHIRRWQMQPGSGPPARRRVQGILAAIQRLGRHPCTYRRGDHPGTRQMGIEGHVEIYEVHPDTGRDTTAGDVAVLRVFGPGQSRDIL
jgi:plasmid stabilization system protein ParE